MAVTSSVRVLCQAGNMPNTIPVASASTAANTSTAGSRPNRSVSRTSGGASAAMLVSVQVVTSRPASAPKKARSTDSVSNWIMTWRRLAPRARRTPISIARAGAARQQEIRDIGARDEEHDPGDAEQHEQRRLRVAVHGALPPRARSEDDPLHPELGHELITHALVERRLDVGHDGAVERVEAGAGLRQGHSRLQAPEDISPVVPTILEPAEPGREHTPHADRHEHQRVDAERGPLKGPGGHAHDGHRLSIDAQRAAQDSRITPELGLPIAVAEHRDVVGAGPLVVGGHRELTKQDLIEEGKDGGIGPDAEREGNDRDAGDERGLEEGAEGQCEVSYPGSRGETSQAGAGKRRAISCELTANHLARDGLD